ncbi:tannase/feruloyl esterase family alpha/beta hydrolase [Variovorax sp. V213]|uniref:tannase/feruloyl esterase family alpha/beta hydrolase n=1 Tax=Variovorax sp. V213 TaxID=3065955 RepID=UPI0034E854DC
MSALAAVVVVAALSACGTTFDRPPMTAFASPKGCQELNGMIIPQSAIGMPTNGAIVTSAELVPAAGTGTAAVGQYCKVLGDISPVESRAPKIKFQVNLPAAWNNKAMMFAGGGYNGIMAPSTLNVPAGPADKQTPLGRGYATFGSDSGHQANANGNRDGTFGLNTEALNNFSSDALKKTRDVAMTIIKARYAATATKTYFAGGSTGGREALFAVTRWPQDFDGAIVLYPAWNAATMNLQFGRMTRELAKPGAYPNLTKHQVLYNAAVAACDALDGVTDGLISNVNACNASFNPVTATLNGKPIRCEGGVNAGDSCLSDAQIAAFNTLNTPLLLDYAVASGERTYPGFNTWGTDFGNPGTGPLQPTVLTLSLGTEQPANPMPAVTATAMPPFGSTFWDQWVKYFVTRDPNFNSLTLDPQDPGPWRARILDLTRVQDVNVTDLTPFMAKGGKILMAHGSQDALVSTRATEQFYERVSKSMGVAKVDSFIRYYEIPGYGHAVSSVFNAGWDSVTAFEDWVEKGTAPIKQVVADKGAVPKRTRPLCPYPSWPRYNGLGDVNSAQNFNCVTE